MIILINGASGSGKTYLLEHLHMLDDYKFVPLKKYTTRSRREFEINQNSVDLIYDCEPEYIQTLKYKYSYKGEQYGINQNEIIDEIDNGNIPVIIVRSFDIIRVIKKSFSDVKSLFIIGASGETLKQQLMQQGRHVEDISDSDTEIARVINEYMENIDVVDNFIVNSLYNKELYLAQFLKCINYS